MKLYLTPLVVLFLCLAAAGVLGWEVADSGSSFTASNRVSGMFLMDVTGDGQDEVITFGTDNTKILIGGSAPVYSNGVNAKEPMVAAGGDFDGDGDNDLVTGRFAHDASTEKGISVLLNDGDGSSFSGRDYFCEPAGLESAVASRVNAMAVADMNGDGDLDILYYYYRWDAAVSQHNDNALAYLPGNGDGTFGSPVTILTEGGTLGSNYPSMSAFEIADLNGDGLNDIFFKGWWNGYVLAQAGGGYESSRTGFPVAHNGHDAALGDVDGDGDLDVVLHHHSMFVRLNDGTGSFSSGHNFDVKPGNGRVHLVDITGDGVLDLVGATYADNNALIRVWEGPLLDRTYGQAPTVLYLDDSATTNRAGPVAVGDTNGDGLPDIYFGVINWWGKSTKIFLYRGVPEIVMGTTASGTQMKCTSDGCEEFDSAAGRWVSTDATSDDITSGSTALSAEFQPYGTDGDEAKVTADGTLVVKSADGSIHTYRVATCA